MGGEDHGAPVGERAGHLLAECVSERVEGEGGFDFEGGRTCERFERREGKEVSGREETDVAWIEVRRDERKRMKKEKMGLRGCIIVQLDVRNEHDGGEG